MTSAPSRTYWNAGMVNRAHGNGKISGVFVFNTESMKITRRIFVTFVARIYTVHPRVWPDLFIHRRYWTYGFWVIGKFAKTQDTANINLILVNDCGIYVESKSKKLGPDVYIGLCRFTLAWSSSRAYVVGSAWFEMAELLRALVLQKEAHRFPEPTTIPLYLVWVYVDGREDVCRLYKAIYGQTQLQLGISSDFCNVIFLLLGLVSTSGKEEEEEEEEEEVEEKAEGISTRLLIRELRGVLNDSSNVGLWHFATVLTSL
ncbi:hypothetical protein E4T42_03609 [Aureobasidium subglaciale]|nr:hypothetical protein E4T42_03609 [Aureobasidium subglaciale]